MRIGPGIVEHPLWQGSDPPVSYLEELVKLDVQEPITQGFKGHQINMRSRGDSISFCPWGASLNLRDPLDHLIGTRSIEYIHCHDV